MYSWDINRQLVMREREGTTRVDQERQITNFKNSKLLNIFFSFCVTTLNNN